MPLFKLSEWEDVISNIDLARVRHISVFQNEDCYVTDLLTSDYGVITSEPVMMGYAATYNDYSRGQDTNRTISQVVVPLYCKDSSNASSQKVFFVSRCLLSLCLGHSTLSLCYFLF